MTEVNFPAITLCEDHGSDTGEYVRNVFNHLQFPDKHLTVGTQLREEFLGILTEFLTEYRTVISTKLQKSLNFVHNGDDAPYFVYMNDNPYGLVLYMVVHWFESGKIVADDRYPPISEDFGTFVDRVGRLSAKGVGKKVCMKPRIHSVPLICSSDIRSFFWSFFCHNLWSQTAVFPAP